MTSNDSKFTPVPAGVITKEQTLLSIRRLPVAAAIKITQGQLCEPDTDGSVIVAPTSDAAGVEHFVALATADNTSGVSGTITVPLAVRNHFVTVVADNAINPGDWVKASTGTAGRVMRWVPGSDNENLKVGIYWAEEGGVTSKATSAPYLESFTDTENFPPIAAAQGDVIEIQLK